MSWIMNPTGETWSINRKIDLIIRVYFTNSEDLVFYIKGYNSLKNVKYDAVIRVPKPILDVVHSDLPRSIKELVSMAERAKSVKDTIRKIETINKYYMRNLSLPQPFSSFGGIFERIDSLYLELLKISSMKLARMTIMSCLDGETVLELYPDEISLEIIFSKGKALVHTRSFDIIYTDMNRIRSAIEYVAYIFEKNRHFFVDEIMEKAGVTEGETIVNTNEVFRKHLYGKHYFFKIYPEEIKEILLDLGTPPPSQIVFNEAPGNSTTFTVPLTRYRQGYISIYPNPSEREGKVLIEFGIEGYASPKVKFILDMSYSRMHILLYNILLYTLPEKRTTPLPIYLLKQLISGSEEIHVSTTRESYVFEREGRTWKGNVKTKEIIKTIKRMLEDTW